MATVLNNGLIGFSRGRMRLRAPGPTTQNIRPFFCSIHHGGPVGPPRMTYRAASGTVRSWQDYHIDIRGWSDIGYHFLVDGFGRLYQGRSIRAVPAAVENNNTGSIAICFMQDGRHYGLNRLQRRTLRVLFEKGCPRWGVPPLKNMARNPNPKAGVFAHNEFFGHEGNECPGTKIKAQLRARRSRY